MFVLKMGSIFLIALLLGVAAILKMMRDLTKWHSLEDLFLYCNFLRRKLVIFTKQKRGDSYSSQKQMIQSVKKAHKLV